MKKVIIIVIGLMLLALPALACSGGAGNAAAVGAACLDGWEVVKLGGIYHGIIIEIAGSECDCLEDSDICASFQGQLHMINTVEAAWERCGKGKWGGIPGRRMSLCSLEGWVIAEWDGQSNHVCAKFEAFE